MKRIAWGIVLGGATAAAFVGSAAANATGDTWTPTYDVDKAQLFLGPDQSSAAWELPASFTSSAGTTLTGTDYLTTSPGGFNDEFVTDSAVYDQDQLGGGFTNLFYDDGSSNTVVDVMKTPFGNVDLSPLASLFTPQPFNIVTFPAGAPAANIGAALGLYDNIGGLPAGGAGDGATFTPMQDADSSLVWSAPATYTVGTGADAVSLSGTEYVMSPNDAEFVTDSGAVFREQTFGLVNNLYYDPASGPAQDFLETPLGLIDLSSIASWFAPADVSDLTAASPLTDLADAGLYSVLDLGLPS